MSTEANDNDETEEHPFDIAQRNCKEINQKLAATNGAIAGMSFSGAIGYHHYIATGETDPEYLWKVALIQAMEETVFEMMWIDQKHPNDARHEVERQLEEYMDPFTAETVAERFENNLRGLIDSQEDLAGEADEKTETISE